MACNIGAPIGGTPGAGSPDDIGDGNGNGNDNGSDCAQVEPIEFTEGSPPDLLLVVDKSGSMADPLASGGQKWQVMRSALDTVVAQHDASIRFGLAMFPTGGECSPGSINTVIAPGNASTISASLGSVFPDGGTPTHSTMTAALAYYNTLNPNPAGRYVLLATDGEPNCGPGFGDDDTVVESLAAIRQMTSAGIPTYVLGFGGDVNNFPTTLRSMAQAGGTDDYYSASSPTELAMALEAIADAVGAPSCTYSLEQTPASADGVSVFQDGDPVDRDTNHQDGWDYDAASNSVTLYGAACDAIRSGAVNEVRIDLGCVPIVE